MNRPVSFPLAELAIQKGFDKECKEYWNLIEYSTEWIVEHRINPDSVDFMYAPTIADVVMWLYEKHQIWVHAMMSFKEFTPYIQCDWNYKQDAIKEVLKFMEKRFNSPTEAYEAAIEYTLNNLI